MKKALSLLLALPLLLMSSTCEDPADVTVCLLKNTSQDTLSVVVSTEYPDTLYPMNPSEIIYHFFPGEYFDVRVPEDWADREDAVLQFFVYDYEIPRLGTYLRQVHPEIVRYEISIREIRDYNGFLTYPFNKQIHHLTQN